MKEQEIFQRRFEIEFLFHYPLCRLLRTYCYNDCNCIFTSLPSKPSLSLSLSLPLFLSFSSFSLTFHLPPHHPCSIMAPRTLSKVVPAPKCTHKHTWVHTQI